jgi:outer membrane protein TolC
MSATKVRFILGLALLFVCCALWFRPGSSPEVSAAEPTRSSSLAQTDAKDSKLKGLLRERLATLRDVGDQTTKEYQSGRGSFDRVHQALRMLLDAELELCDTDKERVTILEKVVEHSKEFEKYATERVRAGVASTSDALMAKAGRLEVEITLERARAKVSAKSK